MRFRPPRCSIFLSPNPLEPQGFTVGRLDDVDHFVPVVEGVPGNGSLVDGVKGIVDVVGVILLTATTGARTQYLIGCKLEEQIQIFRSTCFPPQGSSGTRTTKDSSHQTPKNNVARRSNVCVSPGRDANSKRTRNSSKTPNMTYKEQKPKTIMLWFVVALSS